MSCRLRQHYARRADIFIELERLVESYRSGALTMEAVAMNARVIMDETFVRIVSVRFAAPCVRRCNERVGMCTCVCVWMRAGLCAYLRVLLHLGACELRKLIFVRLFVSHTFCMQGFSAFFPPELRDAFISQR